MKLSELRESLAEALTGDWWNTYSYPPAVVSPPAVVIVPGDPYLEPLTLGPNTRQRAYFQVTCAVAPLDNAAQLDQLERLVLNCYAQLPAGVSADTASRPNTATVGPSDLLVMDFTVGIVETFEADPDPDPDPDPEPDPEPDPPEPEEI
jgi:hypothetical protein